MPVTFSFLFCCLNSGHFFLPNFHILCHFHYVGCDFFKKSVLTNINIFVLLMFLPPSSITLSNFQISVFFWLFNRTVWTDYNQSKWKSRKRTIVIFVVEQIDVYYLSLILFKITNRWFRKIHWTFLSTLKIQNWVEM